MANNRKKNLIIVITRINATRGSSDDEWTHQWGFVQDKPYDKYSIKGADTGLIIIHGCHDYTDHDLNVFVEEGIKKLKENETDPIDDVSEVYVFSHGHTPKQYKDITKKIADKTQAESSYCTSYTSGGIGWAIDDLEDEIKKCQLNDEVREKIVNFINSIIKSTTALLARLLELNELLLILQFNVITIQLARENNDIDDNASKIEEECLSDLYRFLVRRRSAKSIFLSRTFKDLDIHDKFEEAWKIVRAFVEGYEKSFEPDAKKFWLSLPELKAESKFNSSSELAKDFLENSRDVNLDNLKLDLEKISEAIFSLTDALNPEFNITK